MEKQHITYFDMLRGLAIVFVVFNHSYTGDPMAGTIKEDFYLFVRQIITCAVPIFLAQSGYLLADRVFGNFKDYISFWWSHSFRVWLPMVFWSIPLFFFQDHSINIYSVVMLFAGGYSIYYFIALIIQFYALQPLLKKVTLGGVLFSLIVTCVFVAMDNYITSFKGIHIPLFYECAPFYIWLVYPVLGYYIKKNGRDYNLTLWIILMLISLVACVIETKWLYPMHGEGIGVTKISAVFFSCCVILVLFSNNVQNICNEKSYFYRVLVYIGKISFGIYLIHKYFIVYLVKPYITDSFLLTICTIVLTISFIQLSKKLLPKSFMKVMGFR